MEPLKIVVATADPRELRAECIRLGIQVGRSTRAYTMQDKLRAYSREYATQQRWVKLAVLLFGEDHDLDLTKLNTLIDGIHNKLYERFQTEGLVGTCLLRDTANMQSFIVTGRQNTRVLTTQILRQAKTTASPIGACSVLFTARLAFKDVDEVFTTWEAKPEGK